MAQKIQIDGTEHEIIEGKVLVDGTEYTITHGRTCVDENGYEIPLGIKISTLPIGHIVKGYVDNKETEFIILHHGNPDTNVYDSSCDGTWLMMKDVYEEMAWYSTFDSYTDLDYGTSDVHAYLNSTFFDRLDHNIQQAVKPVIIPYQQSQNESFAIASGSNGLPTNVFLLGRYELYPEGNWTGFKQDGHTLDYFADTKPSSDPKRVAYYNGAEVRWWMRSQEIDNPRPWAVLEKGGHSNPQPSQVYGVRPTFIVYGDTRVRIDNVIM